MAEATQATTFYVDKLLPGSDTNNGTSETTPFVTIQKCFNVVRAGDTCNVKNGTYKESPILTSTGTSSLPITIQNYPGHSPKIDCGTMAVNCVGLNPNGTATRTISYITFQGFEITGGQYSGLKFLAADHLILRRNYIHHTGETTDPSAGGNGVLGGCYACTLDRNIIRHNGSWNVKKGHGLYIGGQGWIITNNLIYDNLKYGLQAAAYQFDPANAPNENYAGFGNALIANNLFAYQNLASGIVIWNAGDGTGPPDMTALMHNIVIQNNIFYENVQSGGTGASGINFLCGAVSAQVRNNVFHASAPRSTSFIGGGTAGSTYNSDILTVNSLTTNPNMINAPATLPTSPDFHLTSGSVAIDSGLNLSTMGIKSDFSGNSRPIGNGYDVGAYEYSGSVSAISPPKNLRVQ